MQIKKIHFSHYKTFENFTINFSNFDVLVGPNNAGKSTVLGAFRILSEGIRKAKTRNAELIEGHNGQTWGHILELTGIPVSLENVFHNYEEGESAKITFYLDNNSALVLFFPEKGLCLLIPEGSGMMKNPAKFKKEFPLEIRFVPVLGPVEHLEEVHNKETARRALLTHNASRNFRNIWWHYPDGFNEFRDFIQSTWPGMDIQKPEMVQGVDKPTLVMFCPEERIPREIYWAGFGFQVWCQMLTFILQAKGSSVLVIDEPDIYLHSDLQRQLVSILRDLDSQVIIATHSIEIITEVEPQSLLMINKKRTHSSRMTKTEDLEFVYKQLGTNANPTLTQLSKTRRALFLEGKITDMQILSLFAQKLNCNTVANRSDFAVIPVEGFNPKKVKDFSKGIEITLGSKILKGVIFDRDYRCIEEVNSIINDLNKDCQLSIIHKRKEIENFLLNPAVLERAVNIALRKRGGNSVGSKVVDISSVLDGVLDSFRGEVLTQLLSSRRTFMKSIEPKIHETTFDNESLKRFEEDWSSRNGKLRLVPGKKALSCFNTIIQKKLSVSLTPNMIINAFTESDFDKELKELIEKLAEFSKQKVFEDSNV